MYFEPGKNLNLNNSDESLGIRQMIENYARKKWWFLIGVVICLAIAFVMLRYEAPKYRVSASVLIKSQNKGRSISDITAFEDLGLFSNNDNSLENQVEFLKSRRLMERVVRELNLNVSYFIEESPIDREVYPNFPVIVLPAKDSAGFDNYYSEFYVIPVNGERFEAIDFSGHSIGFKTFGQEFSINLGNDEEPRNTTVVVRFNENYGQDIFGRKIEVRIRPVKVAVNGLMARLNVELPPDARYSNVLKLSLDETVIEKGISVLNNLIEQYNLDGINDRNKLAKATTEFLDDRLVLLSNELEAIEISAAQFKTSRPMINSSDEKKIFMESSAVTESRMLRSNTELQLVNYMITELSTSSKGELLPANIGLSDQTIVSQINAYNELILKRNRVLKSSSSLNPIVVNLDSEMEVIRNNLMESLYSLQRSTQIELDALAKQSGSLSSKIASVPRYEKEYKDIVRDQETKNSLYLFLLQKREESVLSNAVNVEKAKIIDSAYSNGQVVSPNKKLTYASAILLGLLVPFMLIYILDLMDTKIHGEEDLKELGIPYLGDIPLASSGKMIIRDGSDKSNLAEAFRYVRTNIKFLIDNNKGSNIILLTSTQSGEGKTFSAINLANSLAISGYKVVLLGMDLRAPRFSYYLKDKKPALGVTNFLKDQNLSISDIICKDKKLDNLDIINAGDIPPNPVELLMHSRVEYLFNVLKDNYDFVIVDSAPVGLVTDTIQFAHHADLSIYVVKADFLDKRMIHIPKKLHLENKLPNMAFMINGSSLSRGSYGYGYGYGNERKNKRLWFKRWFKSAAM